MKVLHVAPIEPFNGVSVYVLDLLREISTGKTHQGALLPHSPEGVSMAKEVLGDGVLEIPAGGHYYARHVCQGWPDRIKKSFGVPDVVHFHDVCSPFEAMLANYCVKNRWKYIVSPHGSLHKGAQMRKPVKKIVGNLLFVDRFIRNAFAVHVLNEAEAASVRERFPQARVFVVPNGVPDDLLATIDRFSCVRPARPLDGPLLVGFVGRIDVDHKGLDILIEALKVLERRPVSTNIQLLIAGPYWTKNDEPRLRKLLAGLENSGMVTLIGAIAGARKWEIVSGFDVFLCTSRYEGMPGAVIEAMALGKPCVLTPGTNMQGIIVKCEGGWGVDLSPTSIADMLLFLSKDRSDFARRGLNARRYVRENLLWSKISQEYCQQLVGLLNNG